jgi:hypothetical protein
VTKLYYIDGYKEVQMKYLTAIILAAILLAIPTQPALLAQGGSRASAEVTNASQVASSGVIPTFSIISVSQDNTVTIQTKNFPANDTFTVTMGAMGTKGINGTVIGTTDSGTGGSFQKTYTIPAALYGAYQIAIRLESPSSGYYAYNWFYNNTAAPPNGYSGYPTFSILEVVKNKNVTIKTKNFPANDTFEVRMGWMGTRGVGGTLVERVDSGVGGVFTDTYTIPPKYHDAYQIAIRMESPTSGYYAYNWFYNNTASPPDGYTGYPTFSILDVVENKSVTIQTKNFPANDTFEVRMGWMGTRGVGGTLVERVDSGVGGVFTDTYTIPPKYHDAYKIAIRMESTSSGYYAYNWFYNNTSNGTVPDPIPGYTGYPTFGIESVVRDTSVTIMTNNFPPDDTYNVKMNWMGTRGVGGELVETITSGAGGNFTDTFSIPSFLFGQYQIAIRMESPDTGYYAYNWFYNNTTVP